MAKRIRNRNPRFNRLPLPPAEKIETPLNHLGLVDAQATVEALRSSVEHSWVEGISSRQRAISANKKQFEQALEIFDSVPLEGRVVNIDTNENLSKIAQSLAVVALKPKQSYAPILLAA